MFGQQLDFSKKLHHKCRKNQVLINNSIHFRFLKLQIEEGIENEICYQQTDS